MKKAEYLRKILKVIADIDSVWVLEQIYWFAVNMGKGTEYEAEKPIGTEV